MSHTPPIEFTLSLGRLGHIPIILFPFRQALPLELRPSPCISSLARTDQISRWVYQQQALPPLLLQDGIRDLVCWSFGLSTDLKFLKFSAPIWCPDQWIMSVVWAHACCRTSNRVWLEAGSPTSHTLPIKFIPTSRKIGPRLHHSGL